MASVAKRTWTHNGLTKSAWVVRYVDQGGAHRQKTFDKKKDADRHKTVVEGEIMKGVHHAEAHQMTIEAVAADFETTLGERVRDRRIGEGHRYRVSVDLRCYIVPFIGKSRLAELTLGHLHQWQRDLLAQKRIKPTTARTAARTLKMIYDHAMRREWIAKNPALMLLGELRGLKREPVRTFTTDEIGRLLLALEAPMYKGRRPRPNLFTRCAVHLALFCGLRVGEILGLRSDAVDLETGVLRVRTSLSRRDGLKGPKSAAGVRDVGLPAHIVSLLREWVRRYAVPNEAGLLFTYEGGGAINSDGFRHGAWAPLLRRAGLAADAWTPTFHFHALRHYAASHMIEAGWALPLVARQLGHSKVDMTLSVYAHALAPEGAVLGATQALADRLLRKPVLALPAPSEQELRSDI